MIEYVVVDRYGTVLSSHSTDKDRALDVAQAHAAARGETVRVRVRVYEAVVHPDGDVHYQRVSDGRADG